MMTFSINDGTNIESISYQLDGNLEGTQSSFGFLIDQLEDNNLGKINPQDIRNIMLSTWSSTPFKLTTITSSNIQYIGLDTLNPINRDLKDKKIFIGKRQHQSNDIMSNSSLSSDYDIIFYNTKADEQQQITTKLSILSGINFSSFINVPFIQSQIIFGTSSVSFDFNSLYNINLSSIDPYEFNKDIFINDFKLPIGGQSLNNKVISWNSDEDSMIFDVLSAQLPSTIGTQSSSLSIFGDPTNVNNFNLEFSDSRKSPTEIGDIKLGESFINFSISEILQRVIYRYQPPLSSIRLLPPNESGYVEVGTKPEILLEFSIFKKTFNTKISTLVNMIPGTYPAIINQYYTNITATASGLIPSPLNVVGVNFSVNVTDGTQSSSSSVNIRGIYPYFYGFLSKNSINTSNLLQINTLVKEKSDKDIIIQPGSGFFYFIYDSLYGELSEILDENTNTVSNFDTFIQNFSSPNGLWTNKEFRIYRINNLSTNIPIIYKFKH
jgi:hypothetical protein